jgi:hypothetical protein
MERCVAHWVGDWIYPMHRAEGWLARTAGRGAIHTDTSTAGTESHTGGVTESGLLSIPTTSFGSNDLAL